MGRKIHPLMVEETKTKLSDVSEFISFNLTGVTAAETDVLRREVRGAGGSVMVVKNSVARKALEDLKKDGASSAIDGPTALAWGGDDAIVDVCKILDEWTAKTKRLELNGGWMQGRVLSDKDVKALAKIPPREQLHAMVVGAVAAPMARLTGVLQGLLRGLTVVVKGIAERRNEDG
jgi:large subunit ribosomal protein L10